MAFLSEKGRIETSLAEINVTPLVDVMLVLLVIFMITAPMIHSGVDVNLPRTKYVKTITKGEQFVITIDKYENLYFKSRPIDIRHLEVRLKDLKSKYGNIPIYLKADGDVKFAVVVKIMDLVRESGITNIQIVTKPVVYRKD